MRIYLDVCCMNRPFDDQTQDRIRLEAEAILSVLGRCQRGEWHLVGSGAIDYEISKIPDEDRRLEVLMLARLARSRVSLDEAVVQRGLLLQGAGFTPLDALHISCAEKAAAEIMLTTDDKLVRRAVRSKGLIKVGIANPTNWLMEVLG